MRQTSLVATSLLLVLGACSPQPSAEGDGDGETTGDGDGDSGDGDGDSGDGDGDSGDGDGDSGDGDGDEDPGDGDGDGDSGGDGDGDSECECPGRGRFDQCGVQPWFPLAVTFAWPEGSPITQMDEICTADSIGPGVTVSFDCPSGPTSITVNTEPVWMPAFAVGEQVRLRARESPGMAEGDDWQYMNWRIDRADDSAMLASCVDSGTNEPNFIDDEFATEIVTGLCEPSCGAEDKSEPVGVRFFAGADEQLLFAGQIGELGEHLIRIALADSRTCTDGDPGRYLILITHTDD